MGAIAEITPKLGKFVRLLGSDNEGEVVAAARALVRTLTAQGCDLHDLAKHVEAGERVVYRERLVYRDRVVYPEPAHASKPCAPQDTTDWPSIIKWCHASDKGRLTPWERGFIADVANQFARGGTPSGKQQSVILRCFNKLMAAG